MSDMCPVSCGLGLFLMVICLFGGATVGALLMAVLNMSKVGDRQ